jgi:hypothetical protein
MPKPNYVSKFQPMHEVEYGLKVSARNPSSGKVSCVLCRFCTTFGREEHVGGRRARTRNVKYFTTFRTDGYKRHLSNAHSTLWAQYQVISSDKGKEEFFSDVPVSFVNSIDSHLENQKNHIRVVINGPIVETVVGDLLFHPDDVQSVTRERALQQFKKLDAIDSENAEECQSNLYEVVIKTPRRFNLCIEFVACGASFLMASRLMTCTRAESGLGVYGGCSDVVASNYVRFVCAYCLQIVSNAVRQVWAFSIALDGSIHQGMSYLDLRVRLNDTPVKKCSKCWFVSWMRFFPHGGRHVLLWRQMVRGA